MIAVLDASVALKWQFYDEEASGAATRLLKDFVEGRIALLAPTLFMYEIVSAINVAIERKRIEETSGYSAISYITSLGIELRGFEALIDSTFYLARRFKLLPYDCAYLALAKKEHCDFLTGDKKLFRAIKNRVPWAIWIGDYHDHISE